MSMASVRIAGAGGLVFASGGPEFKINVISTSLSFGIILVDVNDSSLTTMVDWGDGSVTSFSRSSASNAFGCLYTGGTDIRHTYSRPGTYIVRLRRHVSGFAFAPGEDVPQEIASEYRTYATRLTEVLNWGVSFSGLVNDIIGGTFSGCSNLTAIPSHVMSEIPHDTFSGCSSFTDPSGIVGSTTTIGASAFKNSGVTGTTWWPSSQASVPYECFYGSAVSDLSGMAGKVTSLSGYAFSNTTNLESLTGLSSVTAVGSYVFSGNTKIRSLSGLSSVTSVAYCAFADMTGLESAVGLSTSLTSIPQYCFRGCTSLTSLDGLTNVLTFGERCFKGCTSLSRFDSVNAYGVPTGTLRATTFGDGCFEQCTGIKNLKTFPASVTRIPKMCFAGCTGWDTNSGSYAGGRLYIPSQVKSIGEYAFADSGIRTIYFESEPIVYGGTTRRASVACSFNSIDRFAFAQMTTSSGVIFPRYNSGTSYSVMPYAADLTAITGYPQVNSSVPSVTDAFVFRYNNYPYSEYGRVSSPSWAPWGVPSSWNVYVRTGTYTTGYVASKTLLRSEFTTSWQQMEQYLVEKFYTAPTITIPNY